MRHLEVKTPEIAKFGDWPATWEAMTSTVNAITDGMAVPPTFIKMSQPKLHHYVPIVYQNRFVNERGLLWVYDREKRQFAERHPKVICCEKDLYAAKPKNELKDQRLESVVLAQVDGDCATGVRNLISPIAGLPGHYVQSLVAHFVGLQYSRVPSMREFVSAMWERNVQEAMRLVAVNEGRMQGVIDSYEQHTGEKMDVSAKAMVDVVRRHGIKVVVNEIPFLRHVFNTANMVATTVIRASWQVLRAPIGKGFILCDVPVVVVPPEGGRQVGFLAPGAVTYVPLSREACLRLSHHPGGRRLVYRDVDEYTVELINRNISANSVRFVMATAKDELEQVVVGSGCTEPYDTPSTMFERRVQNDNETIDLMRVTPRRYFYFPNGHSP